MKEEFDKKILIRQNLALVTQLHNARTEINKHINQIQNWRNWGHKICIFFTEITNQYKSGKSNNPHIIKAIKEISQLMGSLQFSCGVQSQELKSICQQTIDNNNQPVESESMQIQYNCVLHPILLDKQRIIKQMAEQNSRLKMRLTLINSYQASSIDKVLSQEKHVCYCGGLQLVYFNKKVEQMLQIKQKQIKVEQAKILKRQIVAIPLGQSSQIYKQCQLQNKVLQQRLAKAQKKLNVCKLNHKNTIDTVINSEPYQIMKNQAKQLTLFVSQLLAKLKNYGDYLKLIEKERQTEIEQILTQKYARLQFKKQSIFQLSKSTIVADLLKNVVQVFNQLKLNSSQWLRKLQNRLKERKQQAEIIVQLREQLKYIHKDKNQFLYNMPFRRSCYHYIQCNFYKLLESEKATDFFENFKDIKGLKVNQKLLIKQWIDFIQYFKSRDQKINVLQSQLYLAKKQSAHQLSIQKTMKLQMEEIKAVMKEFEASNEQVKQKFIEIQNKINELQFHFGQYKTKDYFKANEDIRIKKLFEERMSKVAESESLLNSVLQDRSRIFELVQFQSLSFKTQQSEYLTTIQNLNSKIMQLERILQQKDIFVNKYIEDRSKYAVQIDKLKEKLEKAGLSKQLQDQLKIQIQMYKRKIFCRCGRSNQANVALSCSHIFCKQCIQSVIKSRKRCCPVCSFKFAEPTNVIHFKFN